MTEPAAGKWSDLSTRVGSALVMLFAGICFIWIGEEFFLGFVAVICAAMVWELVRMCAPDRPLHALGAGFVAGCAVAVFPYANGMVQLGIIALSALASALACAPNWKTGAGYGAVILLGSVTLVLARD